MLVRRADESHPLVVTLQFATACVDQEAAEPQTTQTRSAASHVLEHDCDVDAGYELDTHDADPSGDLQVVGIYEARNHDAPWWAEPGCAAYLDQCAGSCTEIDQHCDRTSKPHAATAHVAAGGPRVLVLASYDPTNWTVTLEPDAPLERVILSGYHDQTAVVPAGVKVERADLGVAFEWFAADELAKKCADVESPEYCEGFGDYWQRERAESAARAKDLSRRSEAAVVRRLLRDVEDSRSAPRSDHPADHSGSPPMSA